MHARIGVMRALNRHVERVFNPDRKTCIGDAASWRWINNPNYLDITLPIVRYFRKQLRSEATMPGQHIWHIKTRRPGEAEFQFAQTQHQPRKPLDHEVIKVEIGGRISAPRS
jgi:hypothetical protein